MSNLFFALCLSVLPLTTQNANVSVSSEKIVLEESFPCDNMNLRNIRNVQFYEICGIRFMNFEADLYCGNSYVSGVSITMPYRTSNPSDVKIKGSKGEDYTDSNLIQQAIDIALQY